MDDRLKFKVFISFLIFIAFCFVADLISERQSMEIKKVCSENNQNYNPLSDACAVK